MTYVLLDRSKDKSPWFVLFTVIAHTCLDNGKRVLESGISISMNSIHEKLAVIREVLNVFPNGKKKPATQSVVTNTKMGSAETAVRFIKNEALFAKLGGRIGSCHSSLKQ